MEEFNVKIVELKKEIEVEKFILLFNICKKMLVDDLWLFVKIFGFIGVIIIFVVLGGIVVLDILRFVIGLKGLKINLLKFCKKI